MKNPSCLLRTKFYFTPKLFFSFQISCNSKIDVDNVEIAKVLYINIIHTLSNLLNCISWLKAIYTRRRLVFWRMKSSDKRNSRQNLQNLRPCCIGYTKKLQRYKAFFDIFLQGRGSFPFEVSALDVHEDLEWNPSGDSLRHFPIMVNDDGAMFYFR